MKLGDQLEAGAALHSAAHAWRWIPDRPSGRLLLRLGLFLTPVPIVVGAIVGSVWVEDRFPGDDASRALLPAVQHVVTQPIVNAMSRQLERHVRGKAEAAYMYPRLTDAEVSARFLDASVDLAQRRMFAFRLARSGSAKSMAALASVIETASSEHKAFMAQLIGSTGNPAAAPLLLPLLEADDAPVSVAAIRGLSAIGGDDVTARLAGVLRDQERDDQLRGAAALGLGTIGTPSAREALLDTLHRAPAPDLAVPILTGLGRSDFPTVAASFREYLADPRTSRELRVAAVEALEDSSSEAVPFLLELAERDPDPDVRASAAWTVGTHSEVNDLGPTLASLTLSEPEVDVRRRLYEALLSQAAIPADRLLPLIESEKDVAARVAGFNAVGASAYQQPASPVAQAFDERVVPELVQIATAPNSLNIQMRAVFALRRARTPAARNALVEISNRARPQVATAAQNGLRKP